MHLKAFFSILLKQAAIRDREISKDWSAVDVETSRNLDHAGARRQKFRQLTMREINQEIGASRRGKDPLYARTRRIGFVLSERT